MVSHNNNLIVHCTHANKSGAAKYVFELFSAIATQCNNSYLICPEDFEFRKLINENKLILIPKLCGKGYLSKLLSMVLQFYKSTIAILEIKKTHKDKNVVIHFNFQGIPLFALIQIMILKFFGLGTVLTVHDVLPHRWLLPHSMRGVEKYILLILYRCAGKLVVHSSSQLNTLVERFGISQSEVIIAPHGAFSLSDSPLPYTADPVFRILCFGAIRENKGVLLAIEAIQKMRMSKIPVTLVIAGAVSAGEKLYWENCKKLIDADPDGVFVDCQFIDEDRLKYYFENSHIVLLPYKDFYSQSGVASMALSSGRMVVCTAVGGMEEFVENENLGFKINRLDVDSIIEALVRAIESGHDELQKKGLLAFQTFQENYSWVAAAEPQINLYEQILKSKSQIK